MKSIAVVSMFTLLCLFSGSGIARQIGTSYGFKAIYVVGDSFSDTGNLWFLTNGDTPRRHGNGKLYVDYLSAYYRLGEMVPSLLGGTDYAVSGAGVGPGWDFDWPGTSAIEQFETYLHNVKGQGDNRAFYIVQIGVNEFLNQILSGWDGTAAAEETASDLETLLHRVALTPGVDHLWVMTAPDLSDSPIAGFLEQFFPGFSSKTATATRLYNAKLANIVASLNVKDVGIIDLFALEAKIKGNPVAYGITDITTPCSGFLAPGGVTCSNPNEHFYWDHSHRTERVQRFIAELFLPAHAVLPQ